MAAIRGIYRWFFKLAKPSFHGDWSKACYYDVPAECTYFDVSEDICR